MDFKVTVKEANAGKIKAFADVVFDGMFLVKGFKVIEGQNGDFVGFPNTKLAKPYKDKNGKTVEYQDNIIPISAEARQSLIDAILEEFGDESPF